VSVRGHGRDYMGGGLLMFMDPGGCQTGRSGRRLRSPQRPARRSPIGLRLRPIVRLAVAVVCRAALARRDQRSVAAWGLLAIDLS
jgi:hypothetical protein